MMTTGKGMDKQAKAGWSGLGNEEQEQHCHWLLAHV